MSNNEDNDDCELRGVNNVKIQYLSTTLKELKDNVKDLGIQLTAVQNKLTLYEGKFGGIVLTMSVVGAAVGYIFHIAMSYLTRANSP